MRRFAIILLCLTSPSLASAGQKLSLSSVIEAALKNHPEIEALRARLGQTEARHEAAPSLPPPMVELGTMGSNGPFSQLMNNSIEVKQIVPFPSKLTAESRQRASEQEAAEEQLRARILMLVAETRVAYLELYRAREQIRLQEERRRTLEAHAKRIGSLTLSDRMTQTHLLQTRTEVDLASNEIEKARQLEKVSQAYLNVAMGRDPSSALQDLEEPPIPELPEAAAETSTAPQTAGHPRLRALEASTVAIQSTLDRANSAWLPDFAVTYRYNRRYDGVMPNNSEVMVGVDLPFLFPWQPKGRAAEARAQLDEVRALTRESENDLKLQAVKARAEVVSLRSQLTTFTKQILPQAEKRMKIAHSITPSDMESLNEHRQSMETYLDLQLAALNVRVDYEKAVATLESLTPSREKSK